MFSNLNPLGRPTAILEIAIMLLGAALIGFLIAWIGRKPKQAAAVADPKQDKTLASKVEARISQLEKALETAKAEKADLEKQAQSLAEKARENEARLKKELEAAQSAASIDGKSEQALKEAKEKIHSLERKLQEQIVKPRNEKDGLATDSKELDWLKREKEDLERDVRDLEGQIDRLERENSELRALARDKSAAGPALEKLTKERDRLKAELDKLRKAQTAPIAAINADFSHLGTATAADKDALTRINGIGPVVEAKLNQLGIYTYAQISRFSPADMDQIDQILQLFPGRVQREDWVSQAANLIQG
ncbi:MAG TPA: hypothetical protein VHS96_03990 [Bacteroidia bacterium]|nr:hypothetical protein [Bacteroidia bacterium]